ncbi:hypothetical protein Tco_0016764 [Tanacetum coccineum]
MHIALGEVPTKTKAIVHKKKVDYDTTPKEKLPTYPKDKRVNHLLPREVEFKTLNSSSSGSVRSCHPVKGFCEQVHEEDRTRRRDDEDEEEKSDQLVHHHQIIKHLIGNVEANKKADDRVKDGEEDKEGDVTNVNLEGGDVDRDRSFPNFASVFGFNQRVTALESNLSKLKQTNPFAEAISSIPSIVNEYLGSKIKEAVDVAIQHSNSNKLREESSIKKSRIPQHPLDFHAFAQKLIKDQVKITNIEIKSKVTRDENRKYAESSKEPTRDDDVIPARETKIYHLTQELLTAPTYELNKSPLTLIPNAQGRLVIPFDHFINNDLEYLKGGSSSRKYTTSITKTKAADYGQVKWIEDRIPRTTWSVVPIDYDKHAYWGTYHWGPKRQRFYGYATNMETSKDVYSRHMIIAVISLKIMKFFGYSHLEEITVRRRMIVLIQVSRELFPKRLCPPRH